jgi:hypothetical protein
MTDQNRAQSFIERWHGVTGSERANYHAGSPGAHSSRRRAWRLLAQHIADEPMFVGF